MLYNEDSAPLEPLGTSHGTTGSHKKHLEITGLHYLTLTHSTSPYIIKC